MEFNLDEFIIFLKDEFQNNYTKAGQEMKISTSQIQRIANGKSKAGQKSISLILQYCVKNNKNWTKIINISH